MSSGTLHVVTSPPAAELEERSNQLLHQLRSRLSAASPFFIETHIEAGLYGFAMLALASELREHRHTLAPAERREILEIVSSSNDPSSEELVREALAEISDRS